MIFLFINKNIITASSLKKLSDMSSSIIDINRLMFIQKREYDSEFDILEIKLKFREFINELHINNK